MAKLDYKVAQNPKQSKHRRRGKIDRAWALYNLAESARKRFEETNLIADIDEAIALHRQALDLLPTGHQDRDLSLYCLAECLHDRYRKQGTLPDLEEAITLERAALASVQQVTPTDPTHSITLGSIYATGTLNRIL